MAKIKVAFNGMGRIGKNVMRVIVEKFNDQIEIVDNPCFVSISTVSMREPNQPPHPTKHRGGATP